MAKKGLVPKGKIYEPGEYIKATKKGVGGYKPVIPKGNIYEPSAYLKGSLPEAKHPDDPGYQVKKALKSKSAADTKKVVQNIL